MAAFTGSGTGTKGTQTLFPGVMTSPIPDMKSSKDQDQDDQTPQTSRTESRVSHRERGDLETRDNYSPVSEGDKHEEILTAARDRREMAKTLCEAVGRMVGSHGTARMASHLQLLKRDLSKCHRILGPRKTESNYLSIVVLIETDLGNRDWKEITKDELRLLKGFLEVGTRDGSVTFDDYNRIMRRMIAEGHVHGPRFEIIDSDD